MLLIADIGGTNTRCALVSNTGEITRLRVLKNETFAGVDDVLHAYLTQHSDVTASAAALAVAAPVNGDKIRLINRAWSFSIEALRAGLGVKRIEVLNDFTALARALPHLGKDDRVQIGGGTPLERRAIGVLGPGTGLGVSGLIPYRDGWAPIAGEGGHVTLAAADAREAELIAHLRARRGHVSAEAILCGPGLLALYAAVAETRGHKAQADSPEAVTALAESGDAVAEETLAHFFRMLATVASNLALTIGAFGGIYLAGGILPLLRARLLASEFRLRFEDKGRYREYLSAIPTWLITAEYPALIGLKALLEEGDRG